MPAGRGPKSSLLPRSTLNVECEAVLTCRRHSWWILRRCRRHYANLLRELNRFGLRSKLITALSYFIKTCPTRSTVGAQWWIGHFRWCIAWSVCGTGGQCLFIYLLRCRLSILMEACCTEIRVSNKFFGWSSPSSYHQLTPSAWLFKCTHHAALLKLVGVYYYCLLNAIRQCRCWVAV